MFSKTTIWLSLFLLSLSGWWLWVTLTTVPGSQDPGEPGPQAFPLLLGVVLGVFALLLLAQGLTRKLWLTPGKEALEAVSWREARIVGSTFLLVMVFAVLMEKIGFLLSTPLALTLAMAGILGMRAWGRIVAVAVGFTLVSYLIFHVLLQANLPHGSWVRFG